MNTSIFRFGHYCTKKKKYPPQFVFVQLEHQKFSVGLSIYSNLQVSFVCLKSFFLQRITFSEWQNIQDSINWTKISTPTTKNTSQYVKIDSVFFPKMRKNAYL